MKENTEISERILQMIDNLGTTKNKFAVKLGYPRSQTLYDIINGKSAPSFDFFYKFLISEYSEIINIVWLITGQGEMLKSNIKAVAGSNREKELEQEVTTLQKKVIELQDKLLNLKP